MLAHEEGPAELTGLGSFDVPPRASKTGRVNSNGDEGVSGLLAGLGVKRHCFFQLTGLLDEPVVYLEPEGVVEGRLCAHVVVGVLERVAIDAKGDSRALVRGPKGDKGVFFLHE